MLWLLFAFASAFTNAVADALCKKATETNELWTVTWVRLGYSIPFLVPLLLFIDIPPLDQIFWITTGILVPLEIAATLLYIKAIQISPLSLTIPFLAFTPLFLLIIPGLMLGEQLSAIGIAGVILVAIGAYLLHIHLGKKGLVEPLRAIAREKGSILMLAAAAIYSLTSTLGKVAIQHSSPMFVGIFYFPFLGLLFLPVAARRSNRGLRLITTSNMKLCAFIGLSTALMSIFHYLAISQANVAYMISVKRSSMIFTTLFGWLFFGERNIGERLFGSVVMLVGVVLISVG
jgi:drug/metabolite transporter (DMT)-like permease